MKTTCARRVRRAVWSAGSAAGLVATVLVAGASGAIAAPASGSANPVVRTAGGLVSGTDAFSLDAPFEVIRSRFLETGDKGALWPAHFAGHSAPYCQIEKLANLAELPDSGFWVACFPIKVARASAGWTRAVGLLP